MTMLEQQGLASVKVRDECDTYNVREHPIAKLRENP